MKCPQCGHEITVGTKSCNGCGARLRWGSSIAERCREQWTQSSDKRASPDGTRIGYWRGWLVLGLVVAIEIYWWEKYPEPVDAKAWIGLWFVDALIIPWIVWHSNGNGIRRWWQRRKAERGRK